MRLSTRVNLSSNLAVNIMCAMAKLVNDMVGDWMLLKRGVKKRGYNTNETSANTRHKPSLTSKAVLECISAVAGPCQTTMLDHTPNLA